MRMRNDQHDERGFSLSAEGKSCQAMEFVLVPTYSVNLQPQSAGFTCAFKKFVTRW